MRHQQNRHRIGRGHSHRKATLAALGNALIRHKRITTTEPKAKALRVYIEPMITRAKADTSHNRRQVFRWLQDKETVSTLFTEISERIGDREGGYTRVVKLGQRAGDGAPMAIIELVDYNDVKPDDTGAGRKRTRRGSTRRSERAKGTETQIAQPAATKTAPGKQADLVRAGAEVQPVEEPVAGAQTIPLQDRTEDIPSEELVDDAQEVIEEQKPVTEAPSAEAEEAEQVEEKPDEDASEDEPKEGNA